MTWSGSSAGSCSCRGTPWCRAPARLPVSAASAFEVGKPATVVNSKAFWLDAKEIGQSDSAPRKLLGGAQVTVKAREGDRLQLVLKGWQVEETPSVIYQARGQRVMMAVLDDAAADKVVRGKPEQDADTGQRWMPVTLEVWSDATGMNADRGACGPMARMPTRRRARPVMCCRSRNISRPTSGLAH